MCSTFIIPHLLQDEYCYTSLLIACQFGHAKVVKTLIDRGADVNYQSKVGIAIYSVPVPVPVCVSLGCGHGLCVLLH